jgi:hypothetical protein
VTRRMPHPFVAVLIASCGLTEPEGPMTLQVAGTLVSAASGLPIANAQVVLGYPAVGCGAGTVQDFGSRATESDAAGRYAHRYDNPCQVPFREEVSRNCGGISLRASAPGYADPRGATGIRCAAQVQLVNFVLDPMP